MFKRPVKLSDKGIRGSVTRPEPSFIGARVSGGT